MCEIRMPKRVTVNGRLYEMADLAPKRIGNWQVERRPDGYLLDTFLKEGDVFASGQMYFGLDGGDVFVSYRAGDAFIGEFSVGTEIDMDMEGLGKVMEASVPVIDRAIHGILKGLDRRYDVTDLLDVCLHGDADVKDDIRSLVSKETSGVEDAVRDAVRSVEDES